MKHVVDPAGSGRGRMRARAIVAMVIVAVMAGPVSANARPISVSFWCSLGQGVSWTFHGAPIAADSGWLCGTTFEITSVIPCYAAKGKWRGSGSIDVGRNLSFIGDDNGSISSFTTTSSRTLRGRFKAKGSSYSGCMRSLERDMERTRSRLLAKPTTVAAEAEVRPGVPNPVTGSPVSAGDHWCAEGELTFKGAGFQAEFRFEADEMHRCIASSTSLPGPLVGTNA